VPAPFTYKNELPTSHPWLRNLNAVPTPSLSTTGGDNRGCADAAGRALTAGSGLPVARRSVRTTSLIESRPPTATSFTTHRRHQPVEADHPKVESHRKIRPEVVLN
jgi:hypothetical protein